MKKIITIYLLVCILPTITIAQWSNNPNHNTVIVDTIGSQILPHLETNNNGETYISWFPEFGDGNFDLYLQKLSKNGVKLWGSSGLQISNHLSGTMVTDYDLKLDNEENVILVTQDMRTGTSNVFAYKISPTGDFLWGNDGIQLSNTANFDTSPKIAVANNNDIVFVWPDVILDTTYNIPLYIKRVSSEGTILWETILADTLYDFFHPQIMAWDDGGFLVSWVTSSNLPDPILGRNNWMHVFVQKLSSEGEALWETKIQVDSGQLIPNDATYIIPYLANDGNGGAYIMWQSFSPFYQGNNSPTTYVNKIDNNGNLWKPNGYNVSSLLGNSHSDAKMEYLEDVEKFMVIWQETHYDAVNLVNCQGIYGQLFSSDGNQLWADTGLVLIPLNCTMDTTYGNINIDESTNNNVVVTYLKDYNSTNGVKTGPTTHIYALTIDLVGDMVWSPPIVPISTTSSKKTRPVISNLVDDQWVVAWEDNIENSGDPDDYGIYAQNISVDGKLGPLSVPTISNTKNINVIISPNPVTDIVNIDYTLTSKGVVHFELYNIDGQLLFQNREGENSAGTHSKQLNVSGLNSGIYLIKLQVNNLVTYSKLIKK